jgi:hypothetical protein
MIVIREFFTRSVNAGQPDQTPVPQFKYAITSKTLPTLHSSLNDHKHTSNPLNALVRHFLQFPLPSVTAI